MNKSDLRQEIRKRKGEFSQQYLDELSIGIVDRILSHPKVIEAHTIFLYYLDRYLHQNIVHLHNKI